MVKKNRSSKAKRSLATLPKGLPQRKKPRGSNSNSGSSFAPSANVNPFENARASSSKGSKFHVHNRPTPGSNPNAGPSTSMARSMARRKQSLRKALNDDKKAGNFVDRRIGEGPGMTEEQRMLARVVRERARRSKKAARFALDDDDAGGGVSGGALGGSAGTSGSGGLLTHKGKIIDDAYTGRHDADDVILSDDDDDRFGGQLDRVDTEMHFGGGSFDQSKRGRAASNPYGPSGGTDTDMADVYRSRKEELDDMIRRRKEEKAAKAKNREEQLETFESLDESFKELAGLLQFRDKEKEKKAKMEAKRAGTLSREDEEMDAWDKEMKTYLFERRVKATDRTKTPEETAKEEAERLHELETRRMARMNGDFEDDDLSDISEDEDGRGRKGRKLQKEKAKKKKQAVVAKKNSSRSDHRNPDELDSDEEAATNDELEVRFTADGLVYVDSDGKVVKKVRDENEDDDDSESSDDDSDDGDPEEEEGTESESEESDAGLGGSEDEASADEVSGESGDDEDGGAILAVGTKVKGNYHAEEQFDGHENWYEGVITDVRSDKTGNTLYDITYDDGDFEEGMKPEYVRRIKKSKEERDQGNEKEQRMNRLKIKKLKAKKKARSEMPYVFEVPTTLEALHDMIGNFASTGSDVGLIIQRIHASNSVRLDKNNKEKMQNFFDVLLRRFVEVGDAIYSSGDGGPELGRYDQLNALTQTLYAMSQDSPGCAGAVWGRRLGIMQKALAKRLRDAEFISADDEDAPSAWPSTGILLLMRALSHIFPVTDLRHVVVTPALMLLGQTVAQCPVRSLSDVVMGLFSSGLIIEYTKEAKRLAPESLAFIAGVLRLFAVDVEAATEVTPVPSFELAMRNANLSALRADAVEYGDCVGGSDEIDLLISIEKDKIDGEAMPTAILCTTLRLVEMIGKTYGGFLNNAEAEVFDEISRSLLSLKPQSKSSPLPKFVAAEVTKAAQSISSAASTSAGRLPLLRRSGATAGQLAIKSLAPRMEDPKRYAMSKDKGKSQRQAILDRNRREYKREHKAATRELRLDAAFIENERRKSKEKRDSEAREQRHKNFAWLEQEQATMNQQVRMGGGLLKGGGIGAAKAKARSGKIGIKKGGKLRN